MTKQSTLFALFACWLAWLGLSPAAADAIADFYEGAHRDDDRLHQRGRRLRHAGARDRPPYRHSTFPAIRPSSCATCRAPAGSPRPIIFMPPPTRDGSVLGLIQNDPPFEPLFGTPEAQFDPRQFNWLGTPSVETAMVLVWQTVPVFSVDDLRTARDHNGRVRRQFDAGVLRAPVQRHARHQDESHSRLSRAERRARRHGARRARRLSERVLQRVVVDAADLACGRHRARASYNSVPTSCRTRRRAIRARSGERRRQAAVGSGVRAAVDRAGRC